MRSVESPSRCSRGTIGSSLPIPRGPETKTSGHRYHQAMHAFVEQRRDALTALCARYPVKRLDLFGSAATEAFDPATSDVDFLVELEDIEPAAYSEAYFGLLEELEDLFGRPVDLVVEEAVTNPYFRESFEKTRTRLYAA